MEKWPPHDSIKSAWFLTYAIYSSSTCTTYMCVHVCALAYGNKRSMLDVYLNHPPHYFKKLLLTKLANLRSKHQGYACLCISPPALHLLHGCCGSELRFSHLHKHAVFLFSHLHEPVVWKLWGLHWNRVTSRCAFEGYPSLWFWPVVSAPWWSAAMWRPTCSHHRHSWHHRCATIPCIPCQRDWNPSDDMSL